MAAGPEPRSLVDVVLDVLDDDEHRRTRIAWLYYVEGQTQAEIAERLGISRIKVVRDLAVCRETGLVQIASTVASPPAWRSSAGSSGASACARRS